LHVENALGARIEIVSLDGKSLYRSAITKGGVDVSSMKKGAYAVKVVHAHGIYTTKLIF
jgi:hypothetical protein